MLLSSSGEARFTYARVFSGAGLEPDVDHAATAMALDLAVSDPIRGTAGREVAGPVYRRRWCMADDRADRVRREAASNRPKDAAAHEGLVKAATEPLVHYRARLF